MSIQVIRCHAVPSEGIVICPAHLNFHGILQLLTPLSTHLLLLPLYLSLFSDSREPSLKSEYWVVAKLLGWDLLSSHYLGKQAPLAVESSVQSTLRALPNKQGNVFSAETSQLIQAT